MASTALTGDVLIDTLNTLLAQRLELLRSGPQISYNVHGHALRKEEYMRYLDDAILNVRKELAQRDVVEIISVAF
jgi:hypothetical protein